MGSKSFVFVFCYAFLIVPKANVSTTSALSEDEVYQLPRNDILWGILRESEQIVVQLEPGIKSNTQTSTMNQLKNAGGHFLSLLTKEKWLFLGDSRFVQIAEQIDAIQSASTMDPAEKLSPAWKPVLKALESHSMEDLAERPFHELMDLNLEDFPFFGNLDIEERNGMGHRFRIEVGFPSISGNSTDFSPAQAAILDWRIPLQRQFGGHLAFEPYHGLLDVMVPQELLVPVLEMLSEQNCVHWIQPKSRVRLHNWRASGIIQSGFVPSEENGIIDPNIHPIWAAGIQGEDQIVGCGDSGVDIYSCFFYDPLVPFEGNTQNTKQGNLNFSFESPNHRKIRFYGTSADFNDTDGHGTHVTGILVGNPLSTGDEEANANRGMAPEALLAFIDLGGRNNNTDAIFTPTELSTYYYPITYERGARIHSDSWGSDSPAYDNMASQVDKFVFEHPDFLPIFAAGNYGRFSSQLLTTVTSPATAKNCISVGSTLTAGQETQYSQSGAGTFLIEVKMAVSESHEEVKPYKIYGAGFGSSWNALVETRYIYEVILGDPETGCSTLSPSSHDKIVLLLRGGCPFVDKLVNAQAVGAVAAIVMNNINNGYFEMATDDSTLNSELAIPMASIPQSIGLELEQALQSNISVTVQVMQRTEPEHDYDNIAEFSSSGPTVDFRIKPDIVAPGRVKSASIGTNMENAGQCQLGTSSGTSMATPVVAGAAILVRQYFMDGFYPSGEANPQDAFVPSGALMKATLLGGAFAMDGYTETGLPLEPPPSSRQGFGRVLLESSIPITGTSKWKEGWRIQIIDGANLTADGSHEYCVRALGGPIRVTLVWTDPPASPSAKSALVNDLDLTVRSAGLKGKELLGNGMEDHVNNVERVAVDDMPEGNLAIVVKAHHIAAGYGQQTYALVVQGVFNGILQSIYNPHRAEMPETSEMCIITLAVLESAPKGPIDNNSPTFTFTTQSGVLPINGFECKLTDDDEKTNRKKLHDWTPCTSPLQYNKLSDGEYIFTVRPKNEEVEVRSEFVVDTKVPKALIADVPIAEVSSQESATFQFSADDSTSVTFRCRLEFSNSNEDVRIARLETKETEMDLNTWFPCTSPETFRGFTYGDWTFKVQGKDAAGNEQKKPTEWSWRTTFDSEKFYVRTVDAPLAVSPSNTVTFGFSVVTGDASGKPVVVNQEIECRLFPSNNSDLNTFPFAVCPLTFQISNITDGSYGFEARTQDPKGYDRDSMSFVQFAVDSTEPVITFLERPGRFHGASDLVVKFQANEDVTKYWCSMRPQKLPSSFNQCPGNEFGIVDYQLEDGWYTFQVKAQDQAGNVGFSETVTFLIDSLPPNIDFTTDSPLYRNKEKIKLEFDIKDDGSGVSEQNQTCLLIDESTDVRKEIQLEECRSPMKRQLKEGRYLFTVRAVDHAGLVNEKDLPIVVDLTPPSIRLMHAPTENEQNPSFVLFDFEGSDEPKNIASLVAKYEILLERIFSTESIPSEHVTIAEDGQKRRFRHLLQHQTDSIRIKDGPVIVLGQWMESDAPVILTGMPSGTYAFRVRAIDNAGNVGEATAETIFIVDASLPIPGGRTAESSKNVSISKTMVIAIISACVIFIFMACIVVGCWRRRSRRRRIEKERASAERNAPTFFPALPVTGGSSSSDPMVSVVQKISLQTHQRDEDTRTNQNRYLEDQNVRMAIDRSLEEAQFQEAYRRSLYES